MASNIFRFKQFDVNQSGCAMKINTDGVLLGAIAGRQPGPVRILDIGTGTGVIALMLAQRFRDAEVHAVEIEGSAAACASANASASAFSDRVRVYHTAIEHFDAGRCEDIGSYDLIVSNPPYFVNDLKSADDRKGLARHTNDLFFKQMLERVVDLLHHEGCFWFILPVKQAGAVVKQAQVYGLSPSVLIHLHSDECKKAFRYIVCLDYSAAEPDVRQLNIYQDRGVYTSAYRYLLKDFFLNF